MIRKYRNHKLQTNPRYREEEPHNNHETPGRQAFSKAISCLIVNCTDFFFQNQLYTFNRGINKNANKDKMKQ